MMLKPSIDSLLDKVNSKYSLVILSSKRAHELDAKAKPTLDHFESVKSVGQALEEIDAGNVIADPHPELKRERIRQESEKLAVKAKAEQAAMAEKISNDKM
nr:DNA-directed RNA polymerase subunit omega [Enterococcus timonensis]